MAKDTKTDEKPIVKENIGENAGETINLADVAEQYKKQMEEMLANAKAEAEKILAGAKASVSGEVTEEQKKANEERKAYLNELVEVRLFKDNNKYKDDVYVSINGENCVIKRGIPVKIKRKFALLLETSDIQDYETSILIDEKSNEFARGEL